MATRAYCTPSGVRLLMGRMLSGKQGYSNVLQALLQENDSHKGGKLM